MYVELAAEMDALPPIFIRRKNCEVLPLVTGSSGGREESDDGHGPV
jgi:hypothetical protein